MQSKGILLGLSACLLGSAVATAGEMGAQAQKTRFFHGTASFSLGAFWASQGKTQHINIQGLIGNDYTVSKKNDQNALLGLGYFLDGTDHSAFKLSYGINAFYLAKTNVRGSVFQEGLFENLAYQYNVSHLPVYAALKAMLNNNSDKYTVTVDAGIGPNFMTTSNYSESSIDGGITLPDNAFLGHTTAVFSATAGIGVKFNNILVNGPIELGYRFFYLGQGDFNTRTNQLLDTLQTGNSYANALVLTIYA
jgi:hypothetical protein